MGKLLLVLVVLGVVGCTTVKKIVGPEGTPAYAIDCHPAMPNDCLEKAGEVCPDGYHVLTASGAKLLGQIGNGFAGGQWNQLGGGMSGSVVSVPVLAPNSILVECKARKR